MDKILFADCNGVVNYENVTPGRLEQLKKLLPMNASVCAVLCIIKVDEVLDKGINELLSKHQFDEALLYIKHFVPDVLFVDEVTMGNWKLIPDPKLDKSK